MLWAELEWRTSLIAGVGVPWLAKMGDVVPPPIRLFEEWTGYVECQESVILISKCRICAPKNNGHLRTKGFRYLRFSSCFWLIGWCIYSDPSTTRSYLGAISDCGLANYICMWPTLHPNTSCNWLIQAVVDWVEKQLAFVFGTVGGTGLVVRL